MLELAILGLLHESPMHGYELRKQLNAKARRIPRGDLLRLALPDPAPVADRRLDHRGAGRRRFRSGCPAADHPPWSRGLQDHRRGQGALPDAAGRAGSGDVRRHSGSACTSPSSPAPTSATRLRILEGRRRKIEERREGMRDSRSVAPPNARCVHVGTAETWTGRL